MRNIKLTRKPYFTAEELSAIDNIVAKEKGNAKAVKSKKEFSKYIAKIKRT